MALLNAGHEDEVTIKGYQHNSLKSFFTWVLIFLTCGFLYLLFYWKPDWFLRLTHDPCALAIADKVLIKDRYQQIFVRPVLLMTRDGLKVIASKSRTGIRYQVCGKTEPSVNSRSSLVVTEYKFGSYGRTTEVTRSRVHIDTTSLVRYFTHRKIRYYWNLPTEQFERLRGLEDGVPCSFFHDHCHGLTHLEQIKRQVFYGSNRIHVKVVPIIQLIVREILTPFYIFQVFSICLWYSDEYEAYATCILLVSLLGIGTAVYTTRKMQFALRDTVGKTGRVSVCRMGEKYEDIPSTDLVPGDVIEIPRNGCLMQCDAVLVEGTCVVNESMLTGESVPVTKTALPNQRYSRDHHDSVYSIKEHSRHTLFCGTKVIQARYYGSQRVCAVVSRTGFMTAKGELVRSIMYPKALDFEFQRHTYRFIQLLALAALVGMIFTLVIKITRGESWGEILKRTLDLITITVPPALPAALTIGSVFAQNRLKKEQIYCISPRRIVVCGSLNVICFDKTGTLTEDGLDMRSVVGVQDDAFLAEVNNPADMPVKGPLIEAMATCHSLTEIDGELMGDPLDLKMFEFTNWSLSEARMEDSSNFELTSIVKPQTLPNNQNESSVPYELGIVRQFPFSSSLQRMSVVARILGEAHFNVYSKGAPEMIASLCLPESVPLSFHNILSYYTHQGYRVIALAWKPLPRQMSYVKVQKIHRRQLENQLKFLGLLIMENRLKPETTPVIKELSTAEIRSVMITGDNMLTALSVARRCEIVNPAERVIVVQALPPLQADAEASLEFMYAEDVHKAVEEVSTSKNSKDTVILDITGQRFHFAITGKSFDVVRTHFSALVPKLAVRGTVFARFSPEQKKQMVEALQDIGYYVGMCGDGANDCGALKTAHAGISLSEAEASVASPFTSKRPNIDCVPNVIREGRASLVTAFGIFKYMACYSLTQFASVLLLYWVNSNLSDWEFLFIDMFIITSLSITFSWTHAWKKLHNVPPPISLISLTPILSIILQMSLMCAVQVFVFIYVQHRSWFPPPISAYAQGNQNSTLILSTVVPPTPPVKNYSYPVCQFSKGHSGDLDEVEERYDVPENYAIFAVSVFQYIILAVSFSRGPPYRKRIFSNVFLMINLIILLTMSVWLVLSPVVDLPFGINFVNLFEMCLPKSFEFRLVMLGIAFVNFVFSLLIEMYVLDGPLVRHRLDQLSDKICGRLFPSKRTTGSYKRIEEEIQQSAPDWPPVVEGAVANLAAAETVASQMNNLVSNDNDDDDSLITPDADNPGNSRSTLHTEASFYTAATSLAADIPQQKDDISKKAHKENGSIDTGIILAEPKQTSFTAELLGYTEMEVDTFQNMKILHESAI